MHEFFNEIENIYRKNIQLRENFCAYSEVFRICQKQLSCSLLVSEIIATQISSGIYHFNGLIFSPLASKFLCQKFSMEFGIPADEITEILEEVQHKMNSILWKSSNNANSEFVNELILRFFCSDSPENIQFGLNIWPTDLCENVRKICNGLKSGGMNLSSQTQCFPQHNLFESAFLEAMNVLAADPLNLLHLRMKFLASPQSQYFTWSKISGVVALLATHVSPQKIMLMPPSPNTLKQAWNALQSTREKNGFCCSILLDWLDHPSDEAQLESLFLLAERLGYVWTMGTTPKRSFGLSAAGLYSFKPFHNAVTLALTDQN